MTCGITEEKKWAEANFKDYGYTAIRLDLFTTENYHQSSELLRYCVAYTEGTDAGVLLEAGSRGHFRRYSKTSPSPRSRGCGRERERERRRYYTIVVCSFIYDAHVLTLSPVFYSPLYTEILMCFASATSSRTFLLARYIVLLLFKKNLNIKTARRKKLKEKKKQNHVK